MGPLSRRDFLARGSILSAAAATIGTSSTFADDTKPVSTKAGSANDRLRVAVVGVRGQGKSHVGGYNGKNNCEIVAICDCDEAVIGNAMDAITKVRGEPPRYVKDFRKLLDDKTIDAVSLAVPNHWHALMAVWAMRAGKDVYCEKPASHNVREGRLMVEAARKYNRICQVGTQSRSGKGVRDAMEFIREGGIGKVTISYGTCYKPRGSIGDAGLKNGEQAPPKTMDYDLWTGPAQLKMPRRNGTHGPVHYDWHWIWEYGNGDLGNQGVHEMDKARWGLGDLGLPKTAISVGGRFGYIDDGETANTQLCLFEYPDAHLIFEVRGLATKDYKGSKVGNIYFGDKGYVVIPNYSDAVAYNPDGTVMKEFPGKGAKESHFGNFIRAVRSRKMSDLNCEVEQGHYSAALCHLANISYRLGVETSFDQDIASFAGCPTAVEALTRMKAHLVDNKVDLSRAIGRVGPKLVIETKSERIKGGADLAQANAMLFRDYRKGFDITEAM